MVRLQVFLHYLFDISHAEAEIDLKLYEQLISIKQSNFMNLAKMEIFV